MESITSTNYPFGKSSIGLRMASVNWATTSVGAPDKWPYALRLSLRMLLEVTSPMALLWGKDFVCFPNDAYAALPGAEPILGKPARLVWTKQWSLLEPFLNHVRQKDEPQEITFPISEEAAFSSVTQKLRCSPVKGETGQVEGVILTAVEDQSTREGSEAYARTITDTVPAIIWTTEPNGHCSYLNRQWYDYTGQTEAEAEGFGWLSVTHPEDQAEAGKRFLEANEKQIPFDLLYRLRRYDGSYRWAIDKGSPRFDASGNYLGMIGTVVEVHEQKLAEEALRASEAKLRSIVSTAPVAIGLFVGRDLIVENPNQTFIDIVGKGPDIVGKPLREVMPELVSENQPFLQILDEVFTTGKRFHSYGSQVDIVQQGVMTHNIYNITYSPVFDAEGKVTAILDIAVDVTGEAKARQALKESQGILQSMIDLAELGTYTIDLATNDLLQSPRVANWYGLPEETDVETSIAAIQESDQRAVRQLLASVLETGAYQMEYTVINAQTSQKYILQTVGQVRRNLEGRPTHIDGLIRDVTSQHELRRALEQQVRERTLELASSNDELAATNEELAATNEELTQANQELTSITQKLTQSNHLLTLSNENLQRFAYVASHDLQEPLRKIHQFSDLLKARTESLSGEEGRYLDRIQAAASRMSTLIRDLLSFSRISTQPQINQLVSLSEVVQTALDDLELALEETRAQISVGELPILKGDAQQLVQLFENLLSNALKFRKSDQRPAIEIRASLIAAADLPGGLEPSLKTATYHCIQVRDNGIGFEEQYLDRMFEVFQRLHDRSEYEGTGIGLAIVHRVVSNHGGAITAKSQLHQGATFSIYLPFEEKES